MLSIASHVSKQFVLLFVMQQLFCYYNWYKNYRKLSRQKILPRLAGATRSIETCMMVLVTSGLYITYYKIYIIM